MLGYGTALKMLLLPPELFPNSFTRDEVVALFNTLAKFSSAIVQVLACLLTYLLTYSLTCLLAWLLTYLLTHLLTCLLTHLLTCLLTYLRTYLLAYLITYSHPPSCRCGS